jgi:hypothetical protein
VNVDRPVVDYDNKAVSDPSATSGRQRKSKRSFVTNIRAHKLMYFQDLQGGSPIAAYRE